MPFHNDHNKNKPLTPRQSRTVGALLGLHAGDSLGATLEFQPHKSIKAAYPSGLRDIVGGGHFAWSPGHATDDTDMTRAVLLAYRDHFRDPSRTTTTHYSHKNSKDSSTKKKKVAPTTNPIARRSARHFLSWYTGSDWPDRKPGSMPVDMGGATARGLSNLHADLMCPSPGAGPGSAGNGSLMRCLPTALFQPDHTAMITDSLDISALTHDDPRCTGACAAYNAAAAALVAGADPAYAVRAAEAVAVHFPGDDEGKILAAIRLGRRLDISRAAAQGPHPDFLPARCSGYVLESLTIAIAAILDQRSLEDILVDVVRLGCDTDTNAAVAGGLLGARDGVDAIPRRWRDTLQFGREFRETALEILGQL